MQAKANVMIAVAGIAKWKLREYVAMIGQEATKAAVSNAPEVGIRQRAKK
jgi:hypothetical protein